MKYVINSPGKGIVACALSFLNPLGERMNEKKMVLGINGSSKAIEKVSSGATQQFSLI